MSLQIETTYWNNENGSFKKTNPVLCKLIDDIDPNKKYPLIKAKIPFGNLIVDNGRFNLDIGKNQELITYSAIPLFAAMSKNFEIFVVNNQRIIPLNMVQQGGMIGLFETVDALFGMRSAPPWSVCSGVRSIFLLPRITDQARLKKLSLQYELPEQIKIQHLQDHWSLFRLLSQSAGFKQEWYSEILIFTNPWFDKSRNDSKAWTAFYDYLFKNAWQRLNYELITFNIEMLWEGFLTAISDRRLKPHQYISDHIKHLMLLGTGSFPGFIPAGNTQDAAPILELQRIFIEDYQLKEYLPVFMHTAPLNTINKKKIYYSLSFPTLLEGAPGTSNNKTIMMDLNDIILTMDTIRERAKKDIFIHDIEYSYFHTEKHLIKNVKPSSDLTDYDPSLYEEINRYPDRLFPSMSQFWKGCIGIKKSQKTE